MAQADFANAVQDGEGHAESAAAYLNDNMQKHTSSNGEKPPLAFQPSHIWSGQVPDIKNQNDKICKIVTNLVEEIESTENQGTKSHTVPTIMVLSPDTANSMALCKSLTEAYPLKDSSLKYPVKVHRLFSKGMRL